MNSPRKTRVCVPVCASSATELRQAVERAAPLADIIELRLDCLDYTDAAQFDEALANLGALFKARTRPFILTFRPAEQGGRRALDFPARLKFWLTTPWNPHGEPEHAPDFVDIELDLLASTHAPSLVAANRHSRLICSQHDFEGVPRDLDRLYEKMARTPAQLLKLAASVRSADECLPLLALLERARREGRTLIPVAMGEAGLLTRVLAPSRGAYLTYGSLDTAHATAPGQLSAKELHSLYRIDSIGEQTAVCGLVGSPVAHSVSPHMHNAAFDACGIDAVYLPLEVRDLGDFIRRMAHPRTRGLRWNLRGLSVTAPHKSDVRAHLDWIEPSAQAIGAVNTVVVEDEELRGYNTDASAALAPLKELLELRGARVAVAGAGGAARAVLWSLREHGAHATIFARDIERARTVAQSFDAQLASLDEASFGGFDLFVNATPLGMRGAHEHETPALASQLRGARFVYDLVYNPSETRLMREAREAGCEAVGGLPMLVAQAAEQFKLWTQTEAPLALMRDAAERALLLQSALQEESARSSSGEEVRREL